MYISDLEIKGFKSFAEPTKLKFAEGLTCIVGPNGCGKSNVVDAIRWVFGVQSAKALRGKEMSDVIFSGGPGGKKANFAKVEITFDNTDNTLNTEYSEVQIARKLHRDGKSEYFINNQPAKLRDIRSLFLDTGVQ